MVTCGRAVLAVGEGSDMAGGWYSIQGPLSAPPALRYNPGVRRPKASAFSSTKDFPPMETAQASPSMVAPPSGIEKAPTGINGFDEITVGGLPAGRPSLVCGGPGCGKTLFAMQFLVSGAMRYGEPGVF